MTLAGGQLCPSQWSETLTQKERGMYLRGIQPGDKRLEVAVTHGKA